MKTILISILALSLGGCAYFTDPYYGDSNWSAERKARARSINQAGRALAAQGLTAIPPAPGASHNLHCTTSTMPLYTYTDCY